MRIRRSKFFSDPSSQTQQPPTPQQELMDSKQLTLENMRLQRMIMQNQRIKQKMEAEERNSRLKSLAKMQQAEARKDETEKDNQVKIQKMTSDQQLNPADRNWRLVKSNSRPVPPVPMKN